MFEALFVLTTIDTGTRVGRFLLQEFAGRAFPKWGNTAWWPGAIVSTAAIVAAWAWFLRSGSIGTIWPMFGVANQLLATTALAVATTVLLREAAKPTYALVTFCPMLFVGTTTLTAGVRSILDIYLPKLASAIPAEVTVARACLAVTSTLIVCVTLVLGGSLLRWIAILRVRVEATRAS